MVMWWGILTARYIRRQQNMLVLKIYRKINPHSSEESEDNVVEGESDKYYNDEHVYYFLMERSLARI